MDTLVVDELMETIVTVVGTDEKECVLCLLDVIFIAVSYLTV